MVCLGVSKSGLSVFLVAAHFAWILRRWLRRLPALSSGAGAILISPMHVLQHSSQERDVM